MAFGRKPKSNLEPTQQSPGLHIYAPSSDERAPGYPTLPSWSEVSGIVPETLGDCPHASYACRCGATAEGSGVRGVQDVVKGWNDHVNDCPDPAGQPWERRGMPLPPRKRGRS
ncbi:hypothetical protein ACIPSE_14935 [Streptomyces sp. NPDC090106]|uniref:hypothetical protein n=1 Tax=Streptomyces sp. NPDC090106 TaxID=3365946 RepID=UPI003826A361